MARIHPSFPIHSPLGAGAYREREILRKCDDVVAAGHQPRVIGLERAKGGR